jgi:hypothetical protein
VKGMSGCTAVFATEVNCRAISFFDSSHGTLVKNCLSDFFFFTFHVVVVKSVVTIAKHHDVYRSALSTPPIADSAVRASACAQLTL